MKFATILTILIFAMFPKAYAQEDYELNCPRYEEVPNAVVEEMGNVKGRSSSEIEQMLVESFKTVINEFANRIYVEVKLNSFDGDNLVFSVTEEDNQWSAIGGSSYTVLINSATGDVNVQLTSCWDSGE